MGNHDKLLDLFYSQDERSVAVAMEMAKNPDYAFLKTKIEDYLILYQRLYDETVNVVEPQHITKLNYPIKTIENKKLDKLPSQIRHLRCVEKLYIESCQINYIPPEIGELKNLTRLEIKYCKIKKLPPEIGNLPNLQYLDLSGTKLKRLPKAIGKLESLENLNLTYCELNSLPDTIGQLNNLMILNLDHNHLKRLPKQFGELSSLGVLILNNNNIKRLPKKFKKLTSLNTLWAIESGLSLKWEAKLQQWLPECEMTFRNENPYVPKTYGGPILPQAPRS